MQPSSARKIGGGHHRLIPGWALIPILAGLAGAFYLVFPGQDLDKRVREAKPDQTSVAYLRAKTAHQDGRQDRLALARQQMQIGQLDLALETLEPLAAESDRAAHWLKLEIQRQQFFAAKDPNEAREHKLKLLSGMGVHLGLSPPVSELERMAEWAMELGANRLAADIYERLMLKRLEPTAAWRGLMLAALETEAPQSGIAPPPSAEDYALKAINALIAGDQADEALKRLLRYLKRLPDSDRLLERGIPLARSQGRLDLARIWAEQRLERHGKSTEALQQLIELALADGDPGAARLWGRELLKLSKQEDDNALKRQLKLEIRANDTEAARDLGMKLLERSPEDPALLKRQIELELANGDTQTARDLGRRLLALSPNNITVLREQMARELAANDVTAAWDLGRHLLALTKGEDKVAGVRRQIELEESSGDAIAARDLGRKLLELEAKTPDRIRQQIRRELSTGDAEAASKLGREYLKLAPNDYQALKRQIELELAVGRQDKARDYARAASAMASKDIALYKRQIELEMAAADLEGALKASRQLIQYSPDDREARIQNARLLEWSGHPREALGQWLSVIRQWPDAELRHHTIQLAEQLYDVEAVASLLNEAARQQRLADATLERWIESLERLGEPMQAVAALEDYLVEHPDHRQAWLRLMRLRESLGDLPGAAASFDRMTEYHHPTLEQVIERAQLDSRLFDDQAALKVLRRFESLAADDPDYWALRADAAWGAGDNDAALNAYRKLAALKVTDQAVLKLGIERLGLLIRVQSNPEEQITMAREAWQQSNQDGFWLLAMQTALDAHDYPAAQALVNALNAKPSSSDQPSSLGDNPLANNPLANNPLANNPLTENPLTDNPLADNPRYWRMLAALAEQQRDFSAARSHYQRVLSLDPDDADTVAGYLWLLINSLQNPAPGSTTHTDTNAELSDIIEQWLLRADAHPSLWAPLAVALQQTGRASAAVPWFQREAERKPDDLFWLLSYADLLSGLGREKQALHLRRHVLQRMHGPALERIKAQAPDDPAPLRRMAELIRDQVSDQAGERLINAMLERGIDDPLLHEFQVAWALASDRLDMARHWAFRAHLKRLTLPSWQRLALALHGKDLGEVERLLVENPDLLISDRVEALRALGRDQEALRLAESGIDTKREPAVVQALTRQAAELKQRLPQGWAISLQQDDRGALVIDTASARVARSEGPNSWIFDTRHHQLHADPATLRLSSIGEETELSLLWRRRSGNTTSELRLSGNQRRDKDVTGLTLKHQRRLNDRLGAEIELALNETGDESAGFRVAGLRDSLSLALSAEFSSREFAFGDIALRNYKTRHGSDLGHGLAVSLGVGHRLWMRNPEWRIGINASWNRAKFPSALPNDIQSLFPAGTRPSALLADRGREIGISTALEKGVIRGMGNTGASPRYLIELGSGWGEDDWNQGYRLRFALSSAVLGDDDLSFWGSYAEGLGGVKADDTITFGVQYSRALE